MATLEEVEAQLRQQQDELDTLRRLMRETRDYARQHGFEHFQEGNDPAVPHIAVRDNTATLSSPARYSGLPEEVGRRPRLNFLDGTGFQWVLSDDASDDEIDIQGSAAGAMGPFFYDYLVISSWSGTEGQGFTWENTTFTYKVYSTIQAAVTDAVTTRTGGRYSFLISPGTYDESVVINTDAGDIDSDFTFHGYGPWDTIWGETGTTTHALQIGGGQAGEAEAMRLELKNLRLRGGTRAGGGSSVHVPNLPTQVQLDVDTCWFEGPFRGTFAAAAAEGLIHNSFLTDWVTTGLDPDSGAHFVGGLNISFCDSSGEFDWDNVKEIRVEGGQFRAKITVDATRIAGARATYLIFDSTEVDSTLPVLVVRNGARVQDIKFVNVQQLFSNTSTAAIDFIGDSPGGTPSKRIQILGCDAAVVNHASAIAPIRSTDTNLTDVVVAHNTVQFGANAPRLLVSGNFSNSVFGPNLDPNVVTYDITGTGNLFIPAESAAGSSGDPADIVDGILYDAGSLDIGWRAFKTREDNVINSISASTDTLADDDTSYVEVLGSTVSHNTTGYTMGSIPLGKVVTSSGDISSITEESAVLDNQAGQSVFLPRIGSPTYNFVEDMNTLFHSAGWLDGGVISDSDNQQIDVAAGKGAIRIDTNSLAQLKFFDWAGVVNQDITIGTIRYVGVEYNNGSPQVSIRETENWNLTTDFPLGEVVREGSVLHITNAPWKVGDHARFMAERMHGTNHIARDNFAGGLIFGESGTRGVTVTAGTFWVGLTSFAIGAINTNNGNDFDTYSAGGSEATGVSQWPNEQYDNGGSLANLGSNKWANLWWYLELDGGLVMIYGTAQYATEAQAEAETPPTTIPNRLASHGTLASRFIFQKLAGTAAQILSPFAMMFNATGVTDHGDLAGLDDVATDHPHLLGENPAGAHSDVIFVAIGRGDLVFRSSVAGGVWANLAIGAADTVIKAGADDPFWGNVGHDELTDVVANEHIDHTGVTLTAGDGLSGGGDISANRTFAVDLNELGTETSIDAGVDFLAMVDATDSGSGKILAEDVPFGYDTETTMVDADLLLMVDVTDNNAGKITLANFVDQGALGSPSRTILLMAASGAPTTTAGCSDVTKVEAGANDVDYWVLDFDTGTDESAFWTFAMPDNWDAGTITFRPYWTAASGSGTVVFKLMGRAYANSDAIDQAYTDPGETSTDTLITAGDVHIGPESSAVTINGAAAGGQYVQVKVTRDVSADNLGVDARLLAIMITYGTDQYSD